MAQSKRLRAAGETWEEFRDRVRRECYPDGFSIATLVALRQVWNAAQKKQAA
jgi:hypothetical protein